MNFQNISGIGEMHGNVFLYNQTMGLEFVAIRENFKVSLEWIDHISAHIWQLLVEIFVSFRNRNEYFSPSTWPEIMSSDNFLT